jgi:hypothetical protein
MATYQFVLINNVDYPVYADIAYADEYLGADPTADAWRSTLDEDTKGRALVNATRVLDRLNWQGKKTDEDQALAWPRTGVSTPAGPVDPDVIPIDIVNACCELANQVLNGVDIANFRTTATTQRRIKAGSVEVENFRGAEGYAVPLPWPAWTLISKYLGGANSGVGGAIASGTCRKTMTYPGYKPAWPI